MQSKYSRRVLSVMIVGSLLSSLVLSADASNVPKYEMQAMKASIKHNQTKIFDVKAEFGKGAVSVDDEGDASKSDKDDGAVKGNSEDYASLKLTEKDLWYLAAATAHEAGSNDSLDGKFKTACNENVVCVILNRVKSPSFPNTVYDVLTAPNQFSSITEAFEQSWYDAHVTDVNRKAVQYVLDHGDTTDGALFFMNRNTAGDQSWIDGPGYTLVGVDNAPHWYYKKN